MLHTIISRKMPYAPEMPLKYIMASTTSTRINASLSNSCGATDKVIPEVYVNIKKILVRTKF